MPDLRHDILGMLQHLPKTQDRVAEALHIQAHPTGAGLRLLRIKTASGRHFEWHPVTQRVYYLRPKADGSFIGELVAADIVTHGDAINAANIWNRGYAEGASPKTEKIHLQW